MFRLDFDMLNVDPMDGAIQTLSLDSVLVESLGTDSLPTGAPVATFDFINSGNTAGFTARPQSSPFALPALYDDTAGLLIQGVETEPLRGVTDETIFGFWGAETDIVFANFNLYQIQWTVTSSADDSSTSALPTFRLRVNDSSLKFSALTNLESIDGGAVPLPTADTPIVYNQWVQTPGPIAGNQWIFSFDYLYVAGSGNDPTHSITVTNIEVTAYDLE